MSKCTFSIGFSGSPEDVFSRAKSAVEKQGGSFSGDATGGNFSIQDAAEANRCYFCVINPQ